MYTFKPSNKAKHLRINIYPGGEVVVTIPKNISERLVKKFLHEKKLWIEEKVRLMEQYPKTANIRLPKRERVLLKQKTFTLVQEKLLLFNKHYKYQWNTVSVRDQKTRWGSCSRKKNLSFNCRIALIPERLAEYIVVHELCHLGEFNHSEKFWNLVKETIPDYKQRRSDLKTSGIIFQ